MVRKFILAVFFAWFVLVLPLTNVAFAQTTTVNQSNSTTLDIACVKAAVGKRENAIIISWDKFSVAVKSALDSRKSELLTAWDIQDKVQRQTAIQTAWYKFKISRINVRQALNSERLTSWRQFKTDRAACGSGPTGENPNTDISL